MKKVETKHAHTIEVRCFHCYQKNEFEGFYGTWPDDAFSFLMGQECQYCGKDITSSPCHFNYLRELILFFESGGLICRGEELNPIIL